MSKELPPVWFENKKKLKASVMEYRNMSDRELIDRYKGILSWIESKTITKKVSDGVLGCKDGKKFDEKSFELVNEKYMLCEKELRRRGLDWEIDKIFDNESEIY